MLQPSTRYADQPMSLATRLFGIGGVALITLLVLAGAFLRWQTYTTRPAAPTLRVFDVKAPSAPPEPVSETPPSPKQVQRQQSTRAAVVPTPPETQLRSDDPVPTTVAKPVSDPGPPIEKSSAPEAKPVPPAPQASSAKPTWQGEVLAALNRKKQYPRDAQFARQQGVPYIRFTMDREGKVLAITLERSSGFPSLDREAVALPRRVSPLPRPPDDVPGSTVELVVPVEFFIR